MTPEDTRLAAELRRALEGRIKSNADSSVVWNRVQRAVVDSSSTAGVRTRRRSPVWKAAAILASCLLMTAAAVGVAAAASSQVRHLLRDAIPLVPPGHDGEAMSASGFPLQIQPTPAFQVFYPTYRPHHMPIRGVGQLGGSGSGNGGGVGYGAGCASSRCPDLTHVNLPRAFAPANGSSGLPIPLNAFELNSTDVVWFGFHGVPPDRRVIQIVEWDPRKYPAALESDIRPEGAPLYFRDVHSRIHVALTRGGTAIRLQTNLAPAIARRLIASLRPINVSGK